MSKRKNHFQKKSLAANKKFTIWSFVYQYGDSRLSLLQYTDAFSVSLCNSYLAYPAKTELPMFVTRWKTSRKKKKPSANVPSFHRKIRGIRKGALLILGYLQIKSFWLNSYLVIKGQQPNLLPYFKMWASNPKTISLFFSVSLTVIIHYQHLLEGEWETILIN